MRCIQIAIFCLVAVVASADNLGYNYQPLAHTGSFTPGVASSSNAVPNYATAPSSVEPLFTPATGAADHPTFASERQSFAAPVVEQTADAPQYSAAPAQQHSAQPAELEKEYLTYSVDDKDFEPSASEQVANNLKQGLRVLFIKGPQHDSLEDAALALAKQAAEQQTAIYVLNKQADIGDLANKLNAIRSNSNNKPEVHFVKYRTPEDAANAQQTIQSQYDSLGGHSQSHDGGVAPVLNFASHAPAASAPAPAAVLPAAAASSVPSTFTADAASPSSTYVPAPKESYLPASILRRLRA